MTGLSGADKIDDRYRTGNRTLQLGHQVYVLDDDNMRYGLYLTAVSPRLYEALNPGG